MSSTTDPVHGAATGSFLFDRDTTVDPVDDATYSDNQ